jgi:hypothetical protein
MTMSEISVTFRYKKAVDHNIDYGPWHESEVTVSQTLPEGATREQIDGVARELDELVKVQTFVSLGQAFAYDEQGVVTPIVDQPANPTKNSGGRRPSTSSGGGSKQPRAEIDAAIAAAPKQNYQGMVFADMRSAKQSGVIKNPRHPDFVQVGGDDAAWLTTKDGAPVEKGQQLANIFDTAPM